MISPEACSKTTRIAKPQYLSSRYLETSAPSWIGEGQRQKEMKIIWGNVLRLLKTLWKALSGFGWKKETKAASGNEWDQRKRCCLHFSRKLQQSPISKWLRKVKLDQALSHQQLGWPELVKALKQLNLEVDKEWYPALFLRLNSSL